VPPIQQAYARLLALTYTERDTSLSVVMVKGQEGRRLVCLQSHPPFTLGVANVETGMRLSGKLGTLSTIEKALDKVPLHGKTHSLAATIV
jgi:hypothetical protein